MKCQIVEDKSVRALVLMLDYTGVQRFANVCLDFEQRGVYLMTLSNRHYSKDAYRMSVVVDAAHADAFLAAMQSQTAEAA